MLALIGGPLLSAQSTPADPVRPDPLKLLENVAYGVASGLITPEAGLQILRAANEPFGPGFPGDTGFAYAVLDVGRRLVATDHAKPGETFFRSAQETLIQLVERTPDSEAKAKAAYLQKLSLVRGNYLGNAKDAEKDIDRAIALQPEDKLLRRARTLLLQSNAPVRIPPQEGQP